MTAIWARALARVLGLRIAVTGAVPPRGALVVANHLSYVDILLLAASLPCGFVAKSEVASWPFIGPLCRLAGVVFVDRNRKRDAARAGDAMHRALDRGRTVVLFPEGTSTDGRAVLPFRSALLAGAARAALPVWTAALAYRTSAGAPPAETAVAWVGDDAFTPHVAALLELPSIDGFLRFGAAPIRAGDRKELAALLHDTVAAELDALRAHLPPRS
jgi:1-acyl-sn-glycerol-3-phosphate acyltransferase